MKNIVLIGLSGSGKTSVGAAVARAMSRPFFDTDAMVCAAAGQSVAAVFSSQGERGFRAMERDALREACGADGAVIATGGGAVLSADNVRTMKQNGMVFFLDRSVDEILRTVDLSDRPLLADRADALRTQAKERLPLYRAAADSVLTGGTVRDLAETVQLYYEMTGEE